MNQNVWADTWETAVRTAIGEDGLLFAATTTWPQAVSRT